MRKNEIKLKIHKSLWLLFIGPLTFYIKKKDLMDIEDKNFCKRAIKFSVLSTILMLLFFVIFLFSAEILHLESLYVILSILLPGYIIFYLIIYCVGLSELKNGRSFIYPFVK